jgi:hypothetical protein
MWVYVYFAFNFLIVEILNPARMSLLNLQTMYICSCFPIANYSYYIHFISQRMKKLNTPLFNELRQGTQKSAIHNALTTAP